jgi:two-component system, cell cycle response regulator
LVLPVFEESKSVVIIDEFTGWTCVFRTRCPKFDDSCIGNNCVQETEFSCMKVCLANTCVQASAVSILSNVGDIPFVWRTFINQEHKLPMRILIADPNQLVNRLVRMKLEKWGHEVDIAVTGSAAQDALKLNSYRMVIMDWGLEGTDAPDLCRYIRTLDKISYTYVMFFSERSDHDSVMEAFEAGADDFLPKPLNPQLLMLRLKTGERVLTLEDELRMMSSYDSSTGLITYTTFKSFFATVMAGARRHDSAGTVLFVTLANYSAFSEAHGNIAASKMMAEVAGMMSKTIRASDMLAKVSDDQFCLLLPQTASANLPIVITNLDAALREAKVRVGEIELRAEVDIAYATYPLEDRSSEEVLALENLSQMGRLSEVAEAFATEETEEPGET